MVKEKHHKIKWSHLKQTESIRWCGQCDKHTLWNYQWKVTHSRCTECYKDVGRKK